jgi:hypothetical protein
LTWGPSLAGYIFRQVTFVMSGIFSGGSKTIICSVISGAELDAGELSSKADLTPIVVFDVVAVTATVSLALTLAPPVLSSKVHRSKLWLSMITTMMIFPLLYLLNVGSQFHTEDSPPIGLCILQAGFIYAGMCFGNSKKTGIKFESSPSRPSSVLLRSSKSIKTLIPFLGPLQRLCASLPTSVSRASPVSGTFEFMRR